MRFAFTALVTVGVLSAQVPGYTVSTAAQRAVAFQYGQPGGVALDPSGTLYFCDITQQRIWKVSSKGAITAFAGGGSSAGGLIGDGGPATKAYLSGPQSATFDAGGNMYVADAGNNRIRKIDTTGTITTIAGPGSTNGALGDGGPALNASLSRPTDVAIDSQGNIYIADAGHNRVRILTPDGNINTFAGTGSASAPLGDGGPASAAGLYLPTALALDGSGNIFVSDYGHNRIRKIDSTGTITTVAGNGTAGYTGDGGLGTLAEINSGQMAGDTDPGLLHVASDRNGNLFIADSGTGRLRLLMANGTIHTIGLGNDSGIFVAGDTGPAGPSGGGDPIGVALGANGIIYVSDIEGVNLMTPTGKTFTPLPFLTARNSAGAFGGFGQVAQGTWMEIYGSYLAPDSRTWTGADFKGTTGPTSLDGTSVTIGGQPAYIGYISPGQINVQVPTTIGTGAQPLIVTTSAGNSATASVTVNVTEPGLLAPASFKIGNTQYIAALFSDGVTFVLPVNAIPGVTSRPATAGDTIVLYGIGFGPVTPSTAAGQIEADANSLSNSLQVKIGGAVATVTYDGLTPGQVGLYQINVVVPPTTSAGNVPLTFTLSGAGGQQSLALAVQ
jgi:uncharacterized protein (TIGR03437 family)